MALTVETGAGVTGADSYTSLVNAQAFIDARGLSVTMTEGLLLRAMDVLEGTRFKGTKIEGNPLSFPRSGITDIDGYDIGATEIPSGVINAQVWLAYYIEQGNDPSAVAGPAVILERVDVLEIEYSARDGDTTALSLLGLPNVKASLRGLIYAGTGELGRA